VLIPSRPLTGGANQALAFSPRKGDAAHVDHLAILPNH
jgi:hypothetical protein